jgi:tetratricopeptide (TPR) repeat protein
MLAVMIALGASLVRGADAPPSAPDAQQQERIARLIEQLGDDNYFVRERAQEQLSRLGAAAFDALAAAQEHEDIEIAARAKYLLFSIRVTWVAENDEHEVKQLLEEYDSLTPAERREKLRELASLPGNAGLTALCRLARFERSQLLSKLAAMEIILQKVTRLPQSRQRNETIISALAGCQRPAAHWLQTYVAARAGDAAGAAQAWARVIPVEAAELRPGSGDADDEAEQTETALRRELLGLLWRYQAALAQSLQRPDDYQAALRKVVEYERGEPPALMNLVTWLIEQRAFDAIEALEREQRAKFDSEPILLYMLAEARRLQENMAGANEAAARAKQVEPTDAYYHWRVAIELRQRDLTYWSDEVYRYIIGLPIPAQPNELRVHSIVRLWAYRNLAESLHDRLQNWEAAQQLQAAVRAIEEYARNGQAEFAQAAQLDIQAVKGRMHFFLAMHSAGSDPAKMVHHLDEAVAADPEEADALIALYRLPNQTPERRMRTAQAIKQAVAAFRTQFERDTRQPGPYNQLAWLVGNTEGDFQEALKCSLKSLELRPTTAAYLDTLGRCYYAVGDYENAVKYQTYAVEVEPSSQQMQRQLKLFEEALAKKRQQPPK